MLSRSIKNFHLAGFRSLHPVAAKSFHLLPTLLSILQKRPSTEVLADKEMGVKY